MKKVFVIILSLALMLTLFTVNVSAAEDLVIDMSTVVGKAGFNDNAPCGLWPAAKYTDKYVISFCNYGAYASLGNIDLSKYEAVVVTYARGSDSNYDDINTQFAITTKGALQSGQALVSDTDAGVVAKYIFDGVVSGGWQVRVDETIALNSDYSGEVFIANYLDPALTHGFVVTDIKFVAKQDTSNPATFDIGVFPLVALTLAGFVPLKKRKY